MSFALRLADRLDPPAPVVRPELRNPVTLAAHCDPQYAVRAHLELIADEMAELERAWRAGDDSPRLMINTPPQVGKSRTAVEWGAFWWLCLHPTTSIIIGCYGEDLAEDRGGGIRKLVRLYGAPYGLYLQPGESGKKDWSTTSGASVRAVGIGSGVAGHNADLMFIDDPVRSRADSDSARKRDQTYSWYTADMLTRLSPGAPLILIQTPWDPDDLRGRVLRQEGDKRRGGKWRTVVIPALSRNGETVDKDDPEIIVDPLGRAHGEPIPHPKIERDNLVALRRHWHEVRTTAGQDVRTWESLYQCNPKPREGSLLSWDILRERRWYEHGNIGVSPPRKSVVAVDPSGGGRDVAGIIGGHLGVDGRCYWTHDRSAPMASADWSRAACRLAAEIGAEVIVYEANYGRDMVELAIRTAWAALRAEEPELFGAFCPFVKSVTAKKNKLLRAEPIAQQVKEGRCGTGAYLPELESEWVTWTGFGESPGRIDASVYLAFYLLPVPGSGTSDMAAAHQLAATSLITWGR